MEILSLQFLAALGSIIILDLVLAEPWNDTHAGIATCPVPGFGVVHTLEPDDEGAKFPMKLVLDHIQLLSCHWTLLHQTQPNGAKGVTKDSIYFDLVVFV